MKPYRPEDATAVQEHLAASGALEGVLGRLFALAENYPELNADSAIVEAQETYQEVEAHIAAARRFYNTAVGDLNDSVEIFPGSLIAQMVGVQAMPFYKIDNPQARQPVDVNDYMKSAG